jgi:tetratricopeptide (TPR) repeat protein
MNLRYSILLFVGVLTGEQAQLSAQRGCAALSGLREGATSSEDYGRLGNRLAERGQQSCAIEAFKKGLLLEPKSAPLHYSLGTALYASGQANQADAEFREAIALDPGLEQAHLALGVIAHDHGDRKTALHEWEESLRLNPNSNRALDWIAKARIESGQYTAATDLLRTTALNEDLAIDLIVAESKASFYEKAISDGEGALSGHPDWERVRIALATLLVQRNRLQEAVGLLRTALEVQPDDTDLRVLYLRVLILMNDADTAPRYAAKLLQEHPDNFDALYLTGLLERQGGEYDAALHHLQRAATLQLNHYDVRFNLGVVLAKLHRPKVASGSSSAWIGS